MAPQIPLTVAEQRQRALDTHRRLQGKLSVCSKEPLTGPSELSVLYTPGVAEPCREIAAQPETVWELTGRGNTVAVVSDGSAILGLGNLGAEAGLPVMEGKALLFKEYAGVNAVPLVLSTQSTEEIVRVVEALAPTFGGINLEDIAAPRCFEVERELQKRLDIPVFHDDQHGTAIVVLAALTNAARWVGKDFPSLKVVVNGAGAAGTAITELLLESGVQDITVCDRQGILRSSDATLSPAMARLAQRTNPRNLSGTLLEAMVHADAFIGVSAANVLNADLVRSMAPRSIVFAMANPDPEILPPVAVAAGAEIVATGRSDFPHQINNVLAFPGVFLGSLAVRARSVSLGMKLAAARAIAQLAAHSPNEFEIVPSPFHRELAFQVGLAVATTAIDEGLAKRPLDRTALVQELQKRLIEAGAHQALRTRHWTVRAAEATRRVQERIGEGLLRLGLISDEQCQQILAEQGAGDRRLFGEIALAHGFLDFDTLIDYLRRPGSPP